MGCSPTKRGVDGGGFHFEEAHGVITQLEAYRKALVEYEIQTREQNRIQRRVKTAHFPTYKELADFDFSALPSLNKARILDLTRGEYITKHETLIFIGNPGLGKTHLAISLALVACRQGPRVRFWTAAGFVNAIYSYCFTVWGGFSINKMLHYS